MIDADVQDVMDVMEFGGHFPTTGNWQVLTSIEPAGWLLVAGLLLLGLVFVWLDQRSSRA